MLGGGRERKQHAFLAEPVADRSHSRARYDQLASGPAEQSAHRAEAVGAGHEHRLPLAQSRFGSGGAHAADRLVARHQRVTHAGKWWHPAGPQQTLGAGADPAPGDIHHDVGHTRFGQGQTVQGQVLGCGENDGYSVHEVSCQRGSETARLCVMLS